MLSVRACKRCAAPVVPFDILSGLNPGDSYC